MKQAIGFANKFYTLWSIDTEPIYTTDSNGKAKRMKGKNVKFEFTEDTTDINTVIVNNVTIS